MLLWYKFVIAMVYYYLWKVLCVLGVIFIFYFMLFYLFTYLFNFDLSNDTYNIYVYI